MIPSQSHQVPTILKIGMYFSEIFLANVIFYLLYAGVFASASGGLYSWAYGYMALSFTLAYCLGVAVRPISFYLRSDRRGSIIANVSVAVTVMAAVFLLFSAFTRRLQFFNSWRLISTFVLLYLVLIVWRYICRTIIRILRSHGRNAHFIVLVGYNETLFEIYQELRNGYYGYRVMGIFCDEITPELPKGLPQLGRISDVDDYLKSNPKINQLYCSLPSIRASEIRTIINSCDSHCVRFFSVPQVRNYLKRRMHMEVLGSVPVLYIHDDPLSSLFNQVLKRSFDLVVSGLFLIPFWLFIYPVVAVLTKVLQPGPVFFRQKRNGINGEEFICYKFRSMKVNDQADLQQATEDDPRKTPFGNFLRRTSIDELPQFINVFKGEMSIVGPRPHMVAHTEEYSALIDKYMVRHWVKPGITGWAQVNGARGETKELWQMEDRIKKDIWYIENWSLVLDIKIIFLTIWNGFIGDKQAY